MADRPSRELLDDVFARAARNEVADRVGAYPRTGRLPASHAQRRLCFLEALNGPNAIYNVPFFLRLAGQLDVEALWGALDDLVARHESLRMTLAVHEDDVFQVVRPAAPIERDERDVAGEDAAKALLAEAAREPFDLHRGEPLLRTMLVRAAEDVHLLLVNLHHAVTDGWSEGLLFAELGTCYTARVTGTPADLPPLPVQYPDYAAWEAEPETARLYARQLAHWRGRLADLPARTDIPTDHVRPELLSGTGGSVPVAVPPGLRGRDASLFELATTALAALVHRHNGEDRVVVGAPVANRPRPEWEPVVGYFANTLPVLVDVRGGPTLGELLARVRVATADALSHQNVPFDRVVDALGVPRHPGMNPVFQVMCSVNRVTRAPRLPGLVTSLVEASNDTAKFDLELAVVYDGDEVGMAFDYADDLFDRATIEGFTADYRVLLDALLDAPDTPVADVPLIARPGTGRGDDLPPTAGGGESATCHGNPTGDDRPLTLTEEKLAAVWAEVLGRTGIGRDWDFFAVGGDSLLATKVVARTRRAWPVKPSVRHMLKHRTLGELAAFIDDETARAPRPEVGRALRPEAANAPQSEAAPQPERPPSPEPAADALSLAQRGMWIVNQLDGHGGYYHMPLAVRLRGAPDTVALRAAVSDVARRHEPLRTLFPDDRGRPRQVVLPADGVHVDLPVVDAADVTSALLAETARPFDLRAAIPLRAKLFKVGTEEHVLLLVVHHIACDGLSWAPLCRDLEHAYASRLAGRAPDWPPLPARFADFTRRQAALLDARDDPTSPSGRGLAYWKDRLAGLPDQTPLPRDHTRPAVSAHRAWRTPVDLGPRAAERIAELAGRTGTSAFMVVQAALAAVLSRLGAGHDVPLGTVAAGRVDPEFDDLVGCFINTVVLRVDASGDPSFRELLRRARDTTLDAHQHGDLPFDLLVQELNPPRVAGCNPFFQVMVTLNSGAEPSPHLAGLDCEWVEVPTASLPFDLSLDLTEEHDRGAVTGHLTADAQLFDRATVASLADRFTRLLDAVLHDPDVRLSQVDVLTSAERLLVLDEWARRPDATPPATLPQLFEAAVREAPDAVAVEVDGAGLTYAELDARASALAGVLAARGVRREDTVAFALPRGLDLVTAVLAIGKAGAVFLPLDPALPAERIAFLLSDAKPVLLLSTKDLPRPVGVPFLPVDEPLQRAAATLPEPEPTSAAYIIYTSGSTGRPKGVVVTHTGLAALAAHLRAVLDAGEGSRVLQLTSTTFDVFVAELLLWTASRGTLVVAPPHHVAGGELAALLADAAVTHAMLTPTALSALPERDLPDLVGLVVAGEVFPAESARRWARGRRVVNGYGPTEATVLATTAVVTPDAPPTIGRPVPGMTCHVLDDALTPVPPGVPGELYLAGGALARGYLARPALTAERFLPGPGGALVYRTGDMVRWTADGDLDYLGRVDDQVKIRGVRIEPGEVEAVLRTHPAVADAVVTVHRQGHADARLVAHVRPVDCAGATASGLADEVTAHAARVLPRHLVPTAVVVLAEFPILPSGKVDKAALPAPPDVTAEHVPPSTPVEHVLAEVWRSLFDGRDVGVHDNFFALGGHSLAAVQVLGAIREALGVSLPLSKCFEHPTIAELAAHIDAEPMAADPSHAEPPVVRRRTR